ncbi:2-aminoethylphosphonate--pyruvate transaminase [Paraglaciecola arctica]|uniref:2-aminoethylphosphonate--pyruvate transaminase n=1 Tax=Paraglaciecola arctica BSs20135 TaxID=493475 RepID=K6YI67_9ALTE|nr:2-aminoethylphosphonate--pyruvate transaminase [Paraglaciecola arctica]GAC17852.1 2-aminoethylphosphonate-pyruvate transaminase [Paraglaciecola arctica BSs20135]
MQHYKLLTPGPLTTSDTVKQAMLKDWCTWDDDYNIDIVENIRTKITQYATDDPRYSSVLMQGSGTASVEAVLGSAISRDDKVLIINNGAYGKRMAEICEILHLSHHVVNYLEEIQPDIAEITSILVEDNSITHLAMVHCETTTGMLNPINEIAHLCQQQKITFILDAMSSFGGIEFDIGKLDIGFMISSANKCIQGVPGFGFIVAKRQLLEACKGQAKSLSLDLYEQWHTMETTNGKWRFTSPTHVVRAFYQALIELEDEKGITARAKRYAQNQTLLVHGMRKLGFKTLLRDELQSPIITSFLSPDHPDYEFKKFYYKLKSLGFVIYPGKVSNADCFRIGNIGEIYTDDIVQLLDAVTQAIYW